MREQETGWYEPHQKPVVAGVYKTRGIYRGRDPAKLGKQYPMYRYFDGKFWYLPMVLPSLAASQTEKSYVQEFEWCGIRDSDIPATLFLNVPVSPMLNLVPHYPMM